MKRISNGVAIVTIGLLAAMLGGCETWQEIDRAAGEWARERKAAQEARAQQQRESRWLTAEPKGTCTRAHGQLYTTTGVDTAYVRLKRYFGFRTPVEKKKSMSSPEWLPYTDFQHDALPGVRYNLTDEVTYRGHGHLWMHMVIEREGSRSFVNWSYCKKTDGWPAVGPEAEVERSLAADIKRIVGG